jgi:superfamily II DNA helicase RecQ
MNQELLILTSPPASGKTHVVKALIDDLETRILVIAPLRALVDECKSKWGESCVVMTHEEWLIKGEFFEVVIFDEFHLNYYWGDSFRPRMWEAFYEATLEASLVILMTATLGEEMQKEVKLFEAHFDGITWMDFGNQVLRNKPHRYIKAPSGKWLSELLLLEGKKGGSSLIFCAYREEVLKWEARLKKEGFSVWKCLGGESAEFSARVRTEKPPQFIVSTTVLSHGVNLPQITRIFFLYEVKSLDFWIQMVARGGRRGEAFEVFALEKPMGFKWSKGLNRLMIWVYSFKMRYDSFLKQIEAWFLKD